MTGHRRQQCIIQTFKNNKKRHLYHAVSTGSYCVVRFDVYSYHHGLRCGEVETTQMSVKENLREGYTGVGVGDRIDSQYSKHFLVFQKVSVNNEMKF